MVTLIRFFELKCCNFFLYSWLHFWAVMYYLGFISIHLSFFYFDLLLKIIFEIWLFLYLFLFSLYYIILILNCQFLTFFTFLLFIFFCFYRVLSIITIQIFKKLLNYFMIWYFHLKTLFIRSIVFYGLFLFPFLNQTIILIFHIILSSPTKKLFYISPFFLVL